MRSFWIRERNAISERTWKPPPQLLKEGELTIYYKRCVAYAEYDTVNYFDDKRYKYAAWSTTLSEWFTESSHRLWSKSQLYSNPRPEARLHKAILLARSQAHKIISRDLLLNDERLTRFAFGYAIRRGFTPWEGFKRPPRHNFITRKYRTWQSGPANPQPVDITKTFFYSDLPSPLNDSEGDNHSNLAHIIAPLAATNLISENSSGNGSRVLAQLPIKVGDRPQTFRNANYAWEKRARLRNGVLPGVGEGDAFCHKKVMVNGSFQSNCHHFKKFFETEIATPTQADIHRAISKHAHLLKLREVTGFDPYSTGGVFVNPKAGPGYNWRRSFANKEKAHNHASSVASIRLAQMAGDVPGYEGPSPGLYSIGAREKRADEVIGEDLASRVILMPEAHDSILDSISSQKFLRMLMHVEGAIFLGFNPQRKGYSRLAKLFGGKLALSMDWSKFDSSVGSKLIVAAFGIVRSCFPNGDFYDKYFQDCLSRFIVKDVIAPQGYLYRVDKGIPSGSPWTSIIGSLCNFIIYTTVFESLGCGKALRLALSGDDALATSSAHFGLWAPEAVADRAYAMWGVKSKPNSATLSTWDGPRNDDCPVFLGQVYPCGLPSRPIVDWLNVYLLPNRRMKTVDDFFRRARGATRAYPHSTRYWEMLDKLYNGAWSDDPSGLSSDFWDKIFTKAFYTGVMFFDDIPWQSWQAPPLEVHAPKVVKVSTSWTKEDILSGAHYMRLIKRCSSAVSGTVRSVIPTITNQCLSV